VQGLYPDAGIDCVLAVNGVTNATLTQSGGTLAVNTTTLAGNGLTAASATSLAVNPGFGLVTPEAAAVAIDPTVIQQRVTGTCPAGESIRAIAQNGTVTCNTFYVRTVIVTPGASAAASGTLLINALAAMTGTQANPMLLKLEPGVYDLGAASLPLKPYIDLEGSGQNVTTITSTSTNGTLSYTAGTGPVELRFLTVNNTGTGATGYAINLNDSNASLALTNATANASGATTTYAIFAQQATSLTLTNATASAAGTGTSIIGVNVGSAVKAFVANGLTVTATSASGGSSATGMVADAINSTLSNLNVTSNATSTSVFAIGVQFDVGSTQLSNSLITAGAAVGGGRADASDVNNGASVFISGSRLSATATVGFGVLAQTSGTAKVANTQLAASTQTGIASGGTLTCFGDYNSGLAALNNTCQ
jgi:hypothetical protein